MAISWLPERRINIVCVSFCRFSTCFNSPCFGALFDYRKLYEEWVSKGCLILHNIVIYSNWRKNEDYIFREVLCILINRDTKPGYKMMKCCSIAVSNNTWWMSIYCSPT